MEHTGSTLLAELVDLQTRLGITNSEMARRLGITRQHFFCLLAGKYQPGPKVELGLQRLRRQAKQEALALLAALEEVAS